MKRTIDLFLHLGIMTYEENISALPFDEGNRSSEGRFDR